MSTPCVRLSAQLEQAGDTLFFYCPGCKLVHSIRIGDGPGPRWGYNGNPDAPTFTPSIRAVTGRLICHSFVTDGVIQYLSDSTHHLAGVAVPLPNLDDEGSGDD